MKENVLEPIKYKYYIKISPPSPEPGANIKFSRLQHVQIQSLPNSEQTNIKY